MISGLSTKRAWLQSHSQNEKEGCLSHFGIKQKASTKINTISSADNLENVQCISNGIVMCKVKYAQLNT